MHEMLASEMSHRLKNVFTLVNGLITVSSRHEPSVQPYARALRERLSALDRGLHYLHAPARGGQPRQTLQDLLHTLLEPYETARPARRRRS